MLAGLNRLSVTADRQLDQDLESGFQDLVRRGNPVQENGNNVKKEWPGDEPGRLIVGEKPLKS